MPRAIRRLERFLPIPDALGLALFSITGAAYAIEAKTSLLRMAALKWNIRLPDADPER
ncbi:MAG TPA: hypothetical protein PLU30_18345 [Verrucomicrobiae bacterium]|nr:hypothetical protein [Verrucomicrobiae bacterium]